MKEKFKDRYFIVALCYLVFGVIIILRLVNLQLVNGEKYDLESQRRLLNEEKISARRGNLLDRNGIPIAITRQSFNVDISSAKMSSEQRDRMYLELVNIFEKNGDSYRNSLSKYLTINPIDFGPAIKNNEYELARWKKDMALSESDIELMSTPEDTFRYLRNVKFKINENYSDEDAYKIMTLKYEILIYSYNGIDYLAKDVSEKTVAEIEERHDEFPGVTTDVQPIRKYIDGSYAAHVVGYVRAISGEEYNELKSSGYLMTDTIGKIGVEKAAESFLRGHNGIRRTEQDIVGRVTAKLAGDPVKPGSDVILTIDMDLQKVAMDSLAERIRIIREQADYKTNFGDANAGAVVVLDVNSGEILAMVSYPTFDPSEYVVNQPEFNRAIQGTYAPGSTFKPLVAIAALEEGIITPDTVVYDSGILDVDGHKFICLEYRQGFGAHYNLKLDRALATSCNIYFHKVGVDTGIDKISKWAEIFGLGSPTGIELPGEASGIRPTREYKMETFRDVWRPADTAQIAIGQLYNSYTPLQLANYIATLANGGRKYKPHVIKSIINYDGTQVTIEPEYEDIPIHQETINAVKKGMIAVTNSVEEGTAARIFANYPYKVAGKTGTAQLGLEGQSDNALFVAYAPADNPQIAIAVVIEHGVWGSNAAYVARDILDEYFGLNDTKKSDEVPDTEAPVLVP